jgi:hypothetical protein
MSVNLNRPLNQKQVRKIQTSTEKTIPYPGFEPHLGRTIVTWAILSQTIIPENFSAKIKKSTTLSFYLLKTIDQMEKSIS